MYKNSGFSNKSIFLIRVPILLCQSVHIWNLHVMGSFQMQNFFGTDFANCKRKLADSWQFWIFSSFYKNRVNWPSSGYEVLMHNIILKIFGRKILQKNYKMVIIKAKNYQKLEYLKISHFGNYQKYFFSKNCYKLYLLIIFILWGIKLPWGHGYLFCKKSIRHTLIWSDTFINFLYIYFSCKNFHFCAFTLLFSKGLTLILIVDLSN